MIANYYDKLRLTFENFENDKAFFLFQSKKHPYCKDAKRRKVKL